MICKCSHDETDHCVESKGECIAPKLGAVADEDGNYHDWCLCLQFDPRRKKGWVVRVEGDRA